MLKNTIKYGPTSIVGLLSTRTVSAQQTTTAETRSILNKIDSFKTIEPLACKRVKMHFKDNPLNISNQHVCLSKSNEISTELFVRPIYHPFSYKT